PVVLLPCLCHLVPHCGCLYAPGGTSDCAFESICETCTFFQTTIAFRPTLQAQHDDAHAKGQTHRAQLFDKLLNDLENGEAS
ncbi:hypothetical protein, partial [uncultured Ornithinimicrobium sp.]|uniref:hypothetical protein n=1 Tax=uncultured Ornithinimicrobium sp. TaxID=259307 RepID=UPI002596C44E